MAYAPDYTDEEEDENEGGEQIVGESSEMGQGGGSSSQQSQSSNNPQKSSGSWTNLLSYVGANEGNDAEMGEKIAGGLQNRATDAQNLGNQYSTGANQKISENTIQDSGIADEVKTNASGVVNDQAKKAQFDKQWDAYYNGPKDATQLEGYQDAGQQYKGVEDRAKTAETYDGRYTLLEDEYKRPNYSRGEKTLDSFILGAGQQGQQVLGDIKQNYGNYTSGWNDLVNQVGGNIQNAENTTNETRQKTRDAVNTGIQNQESQFSNYQNQLAAERDAKNKQFGDLQSQLGFENADYFDDVGLDADIGSYLSQYGDGKAMSNLISRNADRSLGDLAQQNEIDNYNALLNLGKIQGGKFQDFSKTGASTDAYKLNTGLVDKARQAKSMEDQLNTKLAAAKSTRQGSYDDMIKTLNEGKDEKKVRAYLKELGITPDQYANAKYNNANFGTYIKKANDDKLRAEQIMEQGDRNSWAPLLDSLGQAGFNLGISKNAMNGPGKNYDFNQLDRFMRNFDMAAPTTPNGGGTAPIGGSELPWWLNGSDSDPIGTGTAAKTDQGQKLKKAIKKKTGM